MGEKGKGSEPAESVGKVAAAVTAGSAQASEMSLDPTRTRTRPQPNPRGGTRPRDGTPQETPQDGEKGSGNGAGAPGT